jgi:pSer/pThr/pTyr-binding forkhead associated (FHA) protein
LACQAEGVTIGRSPDCDLVLDQPQVSRRHAVIQCKPKGYEIQDLDTGNGTFVNVNKITRHFLKFNDAISIGSYRILFQPSQNNTPASSKPDFVVKRINRLDLNILLKAWAKVCKSGYGSLARFR